MVDDSRTMRKVIRRALEDMGYSAAGIIEAADGVEAMARLKQHSCQVDFILADWNMPNMDGLTLLKRLQKVVKKDGSRISFDREKLRVGLEKACWKLPIPLSKLEEIATQIESKVMKEHEQEVDSRELGELSMEALRNLDDVAYVRFPSVYREFKDVTGYMDVLDELARMRGRRK